jgi:transcriptional regulator with XRE-family HTH domain
VSDGDVDPWDLEDFYARFAARVKAAREAAGLSQSTLERQARVPPCTVSRLERGEGDDLAVVALARIAAVLAVPVADLIPVADKPDEPGDEPGRPAGISQWA